MSHRVSEVFAVLTLTPSRDKLVDAREALHLMVGSGDHGEIR